MYREAPDRLALLIACLLVASSAAAQPAPVPDPLVKENATVKLAPHTYVIPDGNVPLVPNVGIVVGSRATLVIDPGLGRRNGEAVLREVGKVSKNTEIYVASTHYHAEHTTGYLALPAAKYVASTIQEDEFAQSGEQLIQTFSKRSALTAELLKDATGRKADIPFDRAHVLDLGEVRVRLLVVGPTHTRGDTGFFVEGDGVLFAGDVVMNNSFLAANQASSMNAWLSAFDAFEALRPTTIVPAHGAVGAGSLIAANRELMRAVQARARELKAQGRSLDETATLVQTEFQAKHPEWPRANGLPAAARAAYAEAPPSPSPPQGQAPPPPGQTTDPFPNPIPPTDGVIRVNVAEFASIPDIDGIAARIMHLVNEPGTRRLFVNDMRGPLYSVSYDGKTVMLYIDTNAPKWEHPVQSMGRERGFQSFAFHPQFAQAGTPGFGKFYTYTDTSNMAPTPDFLPSGGNNTHDTVLLEWTAKTPGAATYDGGPPRELFRMRQPFQNHNAGHMAFNPNAAPGGPEFGLLYLGVADGGSGGDPFNHAQNLGSAFGKIFRIDPLGSNSANKKYGIPAGNPFVKTTGALPEIYALGLRNPQRFAWDPRNNNLFVADIGQNIVEEVSLAPAGANLGWNKWEGSYRFISREGVAIEAPRSDPAMTYPVVEYAQLDPLLQPQSAASGLVVYRGPIKQIANLVLFTDMPVGEIFYFGADKVPAGGQAPIRRVLLRSNGADKTMLQLIQEKNIAQGKKPATRSDLRLSLGPDNQVLLLNKGDGTIRQLVP
jgi:glyoxylase-like metal-dependent hydrolase (beta-lactamase superfamily II)